MKNSVFDPKVQNEDLASKIVVGLERISEVYRVLLWEHAKVLGLSPIQIQILIFVSFHSEALCNVSHLAKEFNVTKPTVSDAIKVLEKKALIEKHASAKDRRAYAIALTTKGTEMVRKTEHYAEPITTLVKQLEVGDQEHFFKTLSTLVSGLNRTGVLSVQRTCRNCRFYKKKGNVHFCQFLKQDLLDRDFRLDCPEFVGQ